jgi:plastocyanin
VRSLRTPKTFTAVLAAGAFVFSPAAGAASAPKLFGKVGPGFTITLKNATGKKVTRVKPGTYTFAISDRSTIHDFTLEQVTGGTFQEVVTGDGFTGSRSVRVKLTPGKWKYYCVAHEPSMYGFFTVR